MMVQNSLCDTCKCYRIFKSCKEYSTGIDKIVGCPNYIPLEPYYNMPGSNYTAMYVGAMYEGFIEIINKCSMRKKIIACATQTGSLTNEVYDYLYNIVKTEISKSRYNLTHEGKYPEEYKKCLSENTNICIGRIFAFIQRMEDSGKIFWSDFIKELKKNKNIYCRNITITYNDNCIKTKQVFFDNKGDIVFPNKNKIIFEHGYKQYNCSKHNYNAECSIEILRKNIKDIEKGKADWLSQIRRYTLTFNNEQKMYFDMY